jgi:bacterioferritin
VARTPWFGRLAALRARSRADLAGGDLPGCPGGSGNVACMKGNEEVLELLNQLLTNELTAINQYFIHAKMCENWGYERLAHKLRDESIDEMKHADLVISRILFLEGVPNLQRYHKLRVGETVKEQLECDLQVEYSAIAFLNQGIAAARNAGDNATEDLMTKILVSEEEHTDWIETQLELIRQVGEQNYLSQQIKKSG